MKRVFLDLGTHKGQGLNEFIQMYGIDPSWEVHTFEANPIVHGIFKENAFKQTPWVKSHNMAVSDIDASIVVNIETPPGEGETGMGTSCVSLDKWNPWGLRDRQHFQTQATVPCFNLSHFILENYNKEDFLLIKMDIEGSEYPVLERMLQDGSIEYVDHLYVEWHSRFFTNKEEMEQVENDIIERISKYDIKLESWK